MCSSACIDHVWGFVSEEACRHIPGGSCPGFPGRASAFDYGAFGRHEGLFLGFELCVWVSPCVCVWVYVCVACVRDQSGLIPCWYNRLPDPRPDLVSDAPQAWGQCDSGEDSPPQSVRREEEDFQGGFPRGQERGASF